MEVDEEVLFPVHHLNGAALLQVSSSTLHFLPKTACGLFINKKKPSKLSPPRFFNAGIRFIGLLSTVCEEHYDGD